MDYPTSKAKPDCSEALGALSQSICFSVPTEHPGYSVHALCAMLQPADHTRTPDSDLHCTAIMYKTNPVNYAVSLSHDARRSVS